MNNKWFTDISIDYLYSYDQAISKLRSEVERLNKKRFKSVLLYRLSASWHILDIKFHNGIQYTYNVKIEPYTRFSQYGPEQKIKLEVYFANIDIDFENRNKGITDLLSL